MTLKKYLLSLGILTLISWGLFFFLATSINPETGNWPSFTFFYFSLFLALSGTINLIGYFVRHYFLKHTLDVYLAKNSFRQSFLFSFLIISVLFMLAENLFSWVNIIILIIILSIIEYILISDTK